MMSAVKNISWLKAGARGKLEHSRRREFRRPESQRTEKSENRFAGGFAPLCLRSLLRPPQAKKRAGFVRADCGRSISAEPPGRRHAAFRAAHFSGALRRLRRGAGRALSGRIDFPRFPTLDLRGGLAGKRAVLLFCGASEVSVVAFARTRERRCISNAMQI